MKWSQDGTVARSVKGHGYYKINKQYVPEPGIEEERYLGWYQPGRDAYDPTGQFLRTSVPGYKTLEEAQRACEENDEITSRSLGL